MLDPSRVLRSDFFPGLGWLMNRKLWTNELSIKWPDGYWDDWLREPAQRQDRKVLRPEISRTYHFGTHGGASYNQFGGQLSKVMLNKQMIDWTHQDLSYLREDSYDTIYWNRMKAAKCVQSVSDAMDATQKQDARIEYTTISAFKTIARKIGLMDDEKAGVPRTAYRGIVETRPHGGEHLLFITPPFEEMRKGFESIVTADAVVRVR